MLPLTSRIFLHHNRSVREGMRGQMARELGEGDVGLGLHRDGVDLVLPRPGLELGPHLVLRLLRLVRVPLEGQRRLLPLPHLLRHPHPFPSNWPGADADADLEGGGPEDGEDGHEDGRPVVKYHGPPDGSAALAQAPLLAVGRLAHLHSSISLPLLFASS